MAEKSTRGIPETVSILLGKKYRVFKGISNFGRLLEMTSGHAQCLGILRGGVVEKVTL